jgi:hypothetical protein
MPEARLELTIPVFEQAKTVHALDLSVTVTGSCSFLDCLNFLNGIRFIMYNLEIKTREQVVRMRDV